MGSSCPPARYSRLRTLAPMGNSPILSVCGDTTTGSMPICNGPTGLSLPVRRTTRPRRGATNKRSFPLLGNAALIAKTSGLSICAIYSAISANLFSCLVSSSLATACNAARASAFVVPDRSLSCWILLAARKCSAGSGRRCNIACSNRPQGLL
jgi:hypothetical protein